MNGEGRLRKAAAYAAWGCAAAASIALLAWTRRFDMPWFVVASVLAGGAAALMRAGREAPPPGTMRPLAAGLITLAVAFTIGAYGLHRFRAIEFDWNHVVAEWERRVSAELHQHMTRVVERGRRAAELAAGLAAVEADSGASEATESLRDRLFRELNELRAGTQVDALAVFTDAGNLFAWAGDHRGRLPEQVRMNPSGTDFAERPLYSYLYFTAPVKGRDLHVVSAVQVETGLVGAAQDAEPGLTDTFAARTDVRAIFRSGPGRGGGVVWSLAEAGDTVVHARIERITQAGIRSDVEGVIRRSVVLVSLGALLVLSVGWVRRVAPHEPPARRTVPLIAWVIALTVAPLGGALDLNRLLGPSAFVLPIPGDITLGTLLALLLPLGALVATIRYRPRAPRAFGIALFAGVAAIALAYPLLTRLLLAASTPPLLEGGARLWLGLQFAGALLLAIVTAVALPRRSAHGGETWIGPIGRRRAGLVTAAGVVLAGVLSLTLYAAGDVARASHDWPLVLWVAPFTLCAVGLASAKGRGATLTRWLIAGWLGATAVLPGLWSAHQSARLASAGRELMSLGAQPQPILDYLLVEFANETVRREAAGEQGVQLLYRSWVASGLAEEPYAAIITLWSPADAPEFQLALGGAEISDSAAAVVQGIVTNARDDEPTPLVRAVVGLQNVTKILTAPLDSGRMLSVAVPPRRSIDRTSMVAPFLGAFGDEDVRLNLIEATADGEQASDTVIWMRSGEGWQSELLVRFPEGDYHAHMEVRVPSMGMQLARGALLIAFDLALLTLLWALGSAARGVSLVPRGGWRTWMGSFRARVTLALFLFFVAPTVLFGWVAFQASAREVERTARALADRAVRQAVIGFVPADGHLPRLATLAGTEILRYYPSGELAEASSPEALELGVYGAWMDPALFRVLRSGEANTVQDVEHLGENSFVLAYHRLSPAGMLAVPSSLSAGEAALRQRELAHLVVFAVVIGGLLSLALSVVVGRQLAGPIGRLRRASTAVGEGHLRVRLPEPPGEFGQLFAAFNRMVRRLRRARAQELRTARVLAWGEMARQIAHEIKNPLTPIKLSVQHLRRAYNDRHPDFRDVLNANVDQILVEIDRLTEIARAFSRYGAPDDGAGPLTAVDVGSVVHDAITLYRAGDSPIIYGEDVEPGVPRVTARTGELKEVLLNLLENARAAIDGGGRIDVRAAAQGESVEVTVRDDGTGIPPELLPRIFDPHFSTRSAGTGLGLAIVRRIVESWGGTVTAESELGKGTIVRLVLHRAAGPPRAPGGSATK